jgi:hypothetical protein
MNHIATRGRIEAETRHGCLYPYMDDDPDRGQIAEIEFRMLEYPCADDVSSFSWGEFVFSTFSVYVDDESPLFWAMVDALTGGPDAGVIPVSLLSQNRFVRAMRRGDLYAGAGL